MTAVQIFARHAALLGLAFSANAGAQTSSAVKVLDALPGSSLTIRGSTSVGARWHCTASDIESRVAVATRVDDDLSVLPDVRGVTIHIPVSALRCQSRPMERAMRRALKADRDTAALIISGRFEIPDDASPSNASERQLVGALRVAGTERNVFLRATIAYEANGSMRVRSIVPLTLTSFGITPPRVLFGVVRARDAIRVEVDLRYPRPSFSDAPSSPPYVVGAFVRESFYLEECLRRRLRACANSVSRSPKRTNSKRGESQPSA